MISKSKTDEFLGKCGQDGITSPLANKDRHNARYVPLVSCRLALRQFGTAETKFGAKTPPGAPTRLCLSDTCWPSVGCGLLCNCNRERV